MSKVFRWMVLGGVGALVVTLGLLGAGMAVAEESEGEGRSCSRERGHGTGRMMAAVDELDLTEEQQASLDALREMRSERSEFRREMRGGCFRDVLAGLSDGEVDAESVHADIDARFDEARGTAHERADLALAFFDSLDEEQKTLLIAEMQSVRERCQERCGQDGRCGERCRGDDCRRGCRRAVEQ